MDRWVDEQEAEWTHRCVGKSVGVWMSASVRRSVGVGGMHGGTGRRVGKRDKSWSDANLAAPG